jgi:uncharacterized protein
MNCLEKETSNYLLNHASQAINWLPWSEESLLKVKELNKPVFVSVGYLSCHWCHVMSKEVFDDLDVSEVLNESFVCIKVDRLEHPDVDESLMKALQVMNDEGGWPLNIFLTPQLRPFYGGTFFPKNDSYGKIGFLRLVKNMAEVWESRREEISDFSNQVFSILEQDSEQREYLEKEYSNELFKKYFDVCRREADMKNGGFGKGAKFPNWSCLSYLLKYAKRYEQESALEVVSVALDKILSRGLFDHLEPSFFRYCTDAEWNIPHFEKMLYDQAQGIKVLVEAYHVFKKSIYLKKAEEIAGFVIDNLKDPQGGFWASMDADFKGEEGAFYTWEESEIEKVFWKKMVLRKDSSLGSKGVLQLSNDLDFLQKEELSFLLEKRSKRGRVQIDKSRLVAWNALLASAFCKLSLHSSLSWLHEEAKGILNVIKEFSKEDKIPHLLSKESNKEYFEDYAYFIQALIDYYEATFDVEFLNSAYQWNFKLQEKFGNKLEEMKRLSKKSSEGFVASLDLYDIDVPSSLSCCAKNFWRLSSYFGNRDLKENVCKWVKTQIEEVERYPQGYSSFLEVADLVHFPFLELSVIADTSLKRESIGKKLRKKTLFENAYAVYSPQTLDQMPDNSLFSKPLTKGKSQEIYLCTQGTCLGSFDEEDEITFLGS